MILLAHRAYSRRWVCPRGSWTLELLRKVKFRHGLTDSFVEKPFAELEDELKQEGGEIFLPHSIYTVAFCAGFFCDASLCTSYGGDCCAPWGEPKTCEHGYEPVDTGESCYDDPAGIYTCCTGSAPSPPPL